MSAIPPLLIVNGRLWPVVDGADALLLENGEIVAVGTAAELAARAAGARVIDARGASVTPGLCDAHLHFTPWARARRQADLHGSATREEALARVRAAIAATPGTAPVVGRGWDASGWEGPPHRAALDAIESARPVLLHRHDFHTLWVNSAALRAAGVTRETPDPEGGAFERDAGGEPTGIVREHAVRAFVPLEESAGPLLDDALLDQAAAALHALGITSVHDFQRNAADFSRMRALAARRRLRVLQHVDEEQCERFAREGRRSGDGDAWFRIGALKLFADGTLGSRTAAMLEPWEDTPGTGMELIAPAELAAIVARAASQGMACAIHAIGDRAVRNALDAFEGCAPSRSLALPARIEHVQLLHPADLPRFAALGVAASMQPQHCVTDRDAARLAWGARTRGSYPWRALLDSGALLAFGSDAPVEPPSAALGLHAALTRCRPGGDSAFEPAQRIGMAEALAAYTRGAARLAGAAHAAAHLLPGAPADVVVWDRDLFACDPARLPDLGTHVTVLGGEIVYESPESGSAAGAVARPGREPRDRS